MTAFAGVPCVKCGSPDDQWHRLLEHVYEPDPSSLEAVAVELAAQLYNWYVGVEFRNNRFNLKLQPAEVKAAGEALARARAIGIISPTDEAAT